MSSTRLCTGSGVCQYLKSRASLGRETAMGGSHTMSFGDTGALRASAISCALAATLPLREWIRLIASLRLRCLLCLGSTPFAVPSVQAALREYHFALGGLLFSLLFLC